MRVWMQEQVKNTISFHNHIGIASESEEGAKQKLNNYLKKLLPISRDKWDGKDLKFNNAWTINHHNKGLCKVTDDHIRRMGCV